DIVASDASVSRRHALVRLTAGGAEVVALGRAPVDVNGAAVTGARSLAHGDEIRFPGLTLAVAITIPRPDLAARAGFALERAGGDAPTTALGGAELPARVAIEMLPRGGRVVFSVGATDRAVYLADRRFDLVVALARPPAGHRAGEFISDDALRAIVWPRRPSV